MQAGIENGWRELAAGERIWIVVGHLPWGAMRDAISNEVRGVIARELYGPLAPTKASLADDVSAPASPSAQTHAAKTSAQPPATPSPTKASQWAPPWSETPFQRMIRASGMLPPMTEERMRETQEELERIKVERPDFYQALVESKERLTKVAEAMYPSPEEYKRLLELDDPKDY